MDLSALCMCEVVLPTARVVDVANQAAHVVGVPGVAAAERNAHRRGDPVERRASRTPAAAPHFRGGGLLYWPLLGRALSLGDPRREAQRGAVLLLPVVCTRAGGRALRRAARRSVSRCAAVHGSYPRVCAMPLSLLSLVIARVSLPRFADRRVRRASEAARNSRPAPRRSILGFLKKDTPEVGVSVTRTGRTRIRKAEPVPLAPAGAEGGGVGATPAAESCASSAASSVVTDPSRSAAAAVPPIIAVVVSPACGEACGVASGGIEMALMQSSREVRRASMNRQLQQAQQSAPQQATPQLSTAAAAVPASSSAPDSTSFLRENPMFRRPLL